MGVDPPGRETPPADPGRPPPAASGQTPPPASGQTPPPASGQTPPSATGRTPPRAPGQAPPPASGQTRPAPERPRGRAAYWLLLLPFFALLYPPLYAHATPHIWGIPFFYWYQVVWLILTAGITTIVYRRTR